MLIVVTALVTTGVVEGFHRYMDSRDNVKSSSSTKQITETNKDYSEDEFKNSWLVTMYF